MYKRPFHLTDAKNSKLDSEHFKSVITPSYFTGHSTQGVFTGRYQADLYPSRD
jgi:hypothetical protein